MIAKERFCFLCARHHLLNVNVVHFLAVKIPALRGDRLIEGSTRDLKHGTRIKVLPDHSGEHQREQDLGKLLGSKLLRKGI